MKPTSLLTAAVAVACLALPASAAAGTITSDGSTVTFTGTSAAEDVLDNIDFDGNATFSGDATAGAGCQPDGNGFVVCALGAGGLATMTINAGDGNDRIRSLITDPIPARALRANLGAGNDTFGGQDAAEVVDGGPGDDDITTYGGADVIDGGPGVDAVDDWVPDGDPATAAPDLFTECPAKLEPEPGFKWCQTLHVTTKVKRVR